MSRRLFQGGARHAAALLLLAAACAPKATPGAGDVPPVPAESPAQTITLTLSRSALGVAADAPLDSVQRAIRQAVAVLQQEAAFEVLATSAPLLTLQVRASTVGGTAPLLEALRRSPAVARVAVATPTETLHPDSQTFVARVPAPEAPIFLVSLHADSVQVRTGVSADSAAARLRRAAQQLRQTYDFELLETLAPLPILRIRPWRDGHGAQLAVRLAVHPWVRAVELDAFITDSTPVPPPD